MAGTYTHSPKLKIGYFAQHQADELVLSETPIDHMSRAMPDAVPAVIRAQLARFGLDADRAETRVSELSGGEKARLLLSLSTREAPHLLILDEPTNHLDLDARDALIRALSEFEGAVILISHDSHLVESVADRFWLVEDGTISSFDGDMAEYRAWLLERARRARAENNERSKAGDGSGESQSPRPSSAQARADRKEQTRALAPLRRKIKDAEDKLAKIEKEKQKIEAKLADPNLYQSGDPGEITSLNVHLAALNTTQGTIEEAWLEAQAELEDASQ